MEILRNSNPRPVCSCDNAVQGEPELTVPLDRGLERATEPIGCTCKPPRRIFRLNRLARKHGQWGAPFWGREWVEEIQVYPSED